MSRAQGYRLGGLGTMAVGLVLSALAGCVTVPETTTAPPSAPPPTEPFLKFSPNDTLRYSALAKEQEASLAGCSKTRSCDRVHFTLGLIALAQNRDAATGHFLNVASAVPRSPLTTSSELWLKLLQTPMKDDDAAGPLMRRVMVTLIREYLDRELGVQDLIREHRAATAQTFQQELSVRDQRIRSLSEQLEALKQIDEDIREKTRPIAPRPMPAPAAH